MMKKITALLLCFLLLCGCSVVAFAAVPEEEITDTVISTTVPDTHTVTVTAQDAKVFYEGVSGEEFVVGRLSEPRLLIRAESGKVIQSVLLNGTDVTEELLSGYLDLAPVYEDKVLTVTTEDEPTVPRDTYTVKGKVTLNDQPLADVDLELRSTVKVTKTDGNGRFQFNNVDLGTHSLTALKDGKVIGYLAFELTKSNRVNVSLQENGAYTVLVDQNGAGVELHLVLNEENGTMAITKAVNVPKPLAPQTGDDTRLQLWGLVLLTSAACAVILAADRRKLKNKNA